MIQRRCLVEQGSGSGVIYTQDGLFLPIIRAREPSGWSEGDTAMFVVCEEHLDEAVDDFLEEFGESPDLYSLEETTFTQWVVPETCHFCDRPPRYLVV